MRVIASALLCLLLAFVSAPASAANEAWTAARATEQVRYTLDKTTWVPLRKGMVVPNKAWISTGPRGRLQLVRGTESIAFQPNTLAAIITRGSQDNRKTEVVQQLGEISLEIEKRQQPHTTVQTPFLAAVVKGTRFTVEVGKTDAAVAVDRGLVQVTSFRSGERSELAAGQGARVDKSGMKVAGLSKKPQITRVAPSRAAVPALGNTDTGATTADEASSQSKSTGSDDASDNGNGSSNSKSSDNGNDNSSGNGNENNSSNENGNGNGNGNGNSGGNGKGNGQGKDKDKDKSDDDEDE